MSEMIRLWKDSSDVAVQLVRVFNCIGFVLMPLIAQPFVRQDPGHGTNGVEYAPGETVTFGNTSNIMDYEPGETVTHTNTSDADTNKSHVMYLFPAIAAFTLIVGVGHVLLFTFGCREPISPLQKTSTEDGNKETSEFSFRQFLLIMPHFLASFFSAGLDISIAALLTTYTTIYLGWSTYDGLKALFTYQISKLICNTLIAILSKWIGPRILVTSTMAVTLATSIVFVIFLEKTRYIIWICMVLFGLSSGLLGSILSWVRQITPVPAHVCGLFTMSFACCELWVPVLGVYLLTRYGIYTFPIFILCLIIICIVMTVVALIMEKLYPHLYRQEDSTPLIQKDNS